MTSTALTPAASADNMPDVRDVVSQLVARRETARVQLERVADALACAGDDARRALERTPRWGRSFYVNDLTVEAMVRTLDADLWGELINATPVRTIVPSADYDAMMRQVADGEAPPFTRENVLAFLDDFRVNVHEAFARRVEAVWRSLSRSHKTNTRRRFERRAILSDVFVMYGPLVSVSAYKKQVVHDLLATCVFLRHGSTWELRQTDEVLTRSHGRRGQWCRVEQAGVRFRAYPKAGTLHVELDPDVQDKLNRALAYGHQRELAEG